MCTLGLLCHPGIVILHVVILLANLGLLWLMWMARYRAIWGFERAAFWFLALVVVVNAGHSIYLLVLRVLE